MGSLCVIRDDTRVFVDARSGAHYRGTLNHVSENHAWIDHRRIDRIFCWRSLSGARAKGGHFVMPQSSVIFGALFVGFLVFIVTKGEIGAYAKVFTG